MPNTILHKRNTTPGAVPASGSLSAGELAINTTDGILFTKNESGVVLRSVPLDPSGNVTTNSINTFPTTAAGSGNTLSLVASNGLTSGGGGSILLQPGAQATTGGDGKVIVKAAGVAGTLQEWRDSGNNLEMSISASGSVTGPSNTDFLIMGGTPTSSGGGRKLILAGGLKNGSGFDGDVEISSGSSIYLKNGPSIVFQTYYTYSAGFTFSSSGFNSSGDFIHFNIGGGTNANTTSTPNTTNASASGEHTIVRIAEKRLSIATASGSVTPINRNFILSAPTYTSSTAGTRTLTNAINMDIAGAPLGSGSLIMTNQIALRVQAGNPSGVPLQIVGAASQSRDHLQIQTNAGNLLMNLDNNGTFNVRSGSTLWFSTGSFGTYGRPSSYSAFGTSYPYNYYATNTSDIATFGTFSGNSTDATMELGSCRYGNVRITYANSTPTTYNNHYNYKFGGSYLFSPSAAHTVTRAAGIYLENAPTSSGSLTIMDSIGALIQTGNTYSKGIVVIGTSGQTANQQEWRDFSGNVQSAIDPSGFFNGPLGGIQNRVSVVATAASGTINFDCRNQNDLFHTSNSTGNFTLNFRGDASTSLNNLMVAGEVINARFMVTNGATPYYNNAVQIDGVSVTPKWQNGTAPGSGNVNSIDSYSFAIIKTGNSAFTVLGSQTRFA